MLVGLALGAVAAIVYSRDIGVGGLRYSDACTHAMDGALIHDWVAAGPKAWTSPMEFAIRQYAHYPLLGIGRVYPPGFAVVEAAFFALFGISAVTARACVVVFGVLGVVGCHRLGLRLMGSVGAATAALALIGAPGIVYWTRQTMLEAPTLCVLVWAVQAVWHYVEKPGWSRWGQVVALVVAAPFFKQTAVFIVPVVGVWLAWSAWRRRIPVLQLGLGAVCVGAPLVVLFADTLFGGGGATHTARVLSLDKPVDEWLSGWAVAYYLRGLPDQVGWIAMGLGGVGAVVSIWRLRRGWGIVWAWFVVFFAMSVLIQHKEQRYFFFGLLPIAMWAGLGVDWLVARIALAPISKERRTGMAQWVGGCAGAVCVAAFAVSGYDVQARIEPDYRPLVQHYADRIRRNVVLFEGHRDGDFIFAARAALGPRACVIVRGSKVLYSCASDKRFSFTSYVEDAGDVRDALDRFGFATVFVEDRNVMGLQETTLLREVVNNESDFRRLGSVPLWADDGRRRRERSVTVFEPVTPQVRRVRFMDIPIPIASRTLRVDLDALTRFEG